MDYEDGTPLDVLLQRYGTLTEAQLKRLVAGSQQGQSSSPAISSRLG